MKKKVWPQRRMQVDAYAAGAPHIFSVLSFFFACPPLSTLFLFTEFVYGIHLIFFQSSCIESLLLRCFRPSRPWERPLRARSTLEFQPASSTQSRASVPRAYRAKRAAVVES